MRISNERLEELIKQLRADFDIAGECCVPEAVAALGKISDLGNALTELKSIRQAETAGVEEVAERIANKSVPFLITDKGKQDGYPLAGIDIGRYAEVIAAELTALLAERDAVLSECREYVQDAVDEQSRGRELLTRIDALTKGGGDGK